MTTLKKYFFIPLAISLIACNKQSKDEKQIAEMNYPVSWHRFDQEFSTNKNILDLRKKYPFLLSPQVSDDEWIAKQNDTLFQQLYQEVQTQFSDISTTKNQVNEVLKRIHYYFPNHQPKKVISLISEVNVENRTIYTDSLVLLSLDTYLGKNHKFYVDFDTYTLQEFEKERIPVDLALEFASQVVPYTDDRTFLGQMIYFGKLMAVAEKLTPFASEELQINYTKEQLQWAKENEENIWKFFVESKFLYNTDPKLFLRFIQKAPFSKFYLEFDQESPGSIGVFIGWQIVKSYINNNKDVSLQNLLIKDTKELFDNAKYKPQRK
ncbi:gliding motility lipoprotein GldB [Capnocytophaga sp. ARDL2]|uniref:gliding motility lipoprotein GldB n=1 Tax=Capnocytophaga sp. ARDL2 TaxID=3238809 RepID=UPI0035589C4D